MTLFIRILKFGFGDGLREQITSSSGDSLREQITEANKTKHIDQEKYFKTQIIMCKLRRTKSCDVIIYAYIRTTKTDPKNEN